MSRIRLPGPRGMSEPRAPLPPRQTGLARMPPPAPRAGSLALSERKQSMLMTIVFFIVGLSVILSYDWTNGGFRPDAGVQIFFGILVATIIYVAARYSQAHPPPAPANLRVCPQCGRSIPGDSLWCPYCGTRFA